MLQAYLSATAQELTATLSGFGERQDETRASELRTLTERHEEERGAAQGQLEVSGMVPQGGNIQGRGVEPADGDSEEGRGQPKVRFSGEISNKLAVPWPEF